MAKDSLRILFFGASGMVGAAVLEQCLQDPNVEAVLSVVRQYTGRSHPKLKELTHPNMYDLSEIAKLLKGYNACIFTLGVSSVGMSEADYTRLTYDLTTSAAKTVLFLNPGMSICYVTGAGTDSTGAGKVMWARVKGRTENALLAMPFSSATMFRLGGLVPLPGFRSKTRIYRAFYVVLAPLMRPMARFFPNLVTTPQILGRAMIRAAQGKAPKQRLEPADIHALGSMPEGR